MGIGPGLALECDFLFVMAALLPSFLAFERSHRFGAISLDRPGGFEIGRRIDPARHGVDDADVDPHPGFQRPELLELFLHFQRGGRQCDKTLQRGAAIGVKADMMVARPVAVRARWRG